MNAMFIIVLFVKKLLMIIILLLLKNWEKWVRITNCKNIFSKRFRKNWSKEIPVMDSVLKTNLWKYKIKELNGGENRKVSWKKIAVEQIINELLFRSRFHIRDKVKVVLDLKNFAW